MNISHYQAQFRAAESYYKSGYLDESQMRSKAVDFLKSLYVNRKHESPEFSNLVKRALKFSVIGLSF